MAQLLDWSILPNNPDIKTPVPDEGTFTYDLHNLTHNKCLKYESRPGPVINLSWGDPGASDNIRFQRQSSLTNPIKFEEPIAIYVRQGGFLIYKKRDLGINLGWSSAPQFEWKLLGGKAQDVVALGKPIGLYSMVENDSLVYDPRDWGINLRWYNDTSSDGNSITDGIRLGKELIDILTFR